MRVTAEMSLYPLAGQPLEKILAFIDTVQRDDVHVRLRAKAVRAPEVRR